MPHTDARDYFVSIIRGDSLATRRTGLLAGPFPTHTAALEMVEPAKAEAHRVDAWTDFDRFGTMSLPKGSGRRGVLNDRLGVVTPRAAVGDLFVPN